MTATKKKPTLEDALDKAAQVCARLGDRDELLDERRQSWVEAFQLGGTYAQIAKRCGVSTHLVRLEVSKAKGRPWATGATQ